VGLDPIYPGGGDTRRVRIVVPRPALVLLVGPSGSGKSSFARQHFKPTETVSSDFCRALVADDENDQSATAAAFDVLRVVVGHRLRRRRLTVVDATNVKAADRRRVLALARAHGTPAVAVIFDIPEEVCMERDRAREGRTVGASVIRAQRAAMLGSLPGLEEEGFAAVHLLASEDAVAAVHVEREPASLSRRRTADRAT
jgi:protein phosphatase